MLQECGKDWQNKWVVKWWFFFVIVIWCDRPKATDDDVRLAICYVSKYAANVICFFIVYTLRRVVWNVGFDIFKDQPHLAP